MHSITGTQLKNLYTLKKIHIETKMNVYKGFHIFACISIIKNCVTGLVLNDKNTTSNSYF